MYNADKPIKSESEDLLGRSVFAKRLGEAILKLSTTDTFVVGLYGEWGSGKTSLLNLMEEYLNELPEEDVNSQIKLIRFYPWGCTDGSQLLEQFFNLLSNEIQSGSSDERKRLVGEAIEKYSFVLNYLQYIPVIGPFLTGVPELAQKIGGQLRDNALSNENNIQYQKESVKNVLSALEQKIVILIDDIDRLPNDQIRMIFQLVNSVADFPNTIYVLSFDYNIVCRALSEEQNCKGEEYLEKIIQIPFVLPAISAAKIEDLFLSRLNVLHEGTIDDLFNKDHWFSVYNNCIKPFINNMRDAYRLLNALEFKYPPVKNLLNPVDVFGITSIEMFAPLLFSWIKGSKFLLTDSSDYYKGHTGIEIKENDAKWAEVFLKLFDSNASLYLKSVSSLFPMFSNKLSYTGAIPPKELRAKLHIGHSDRFDAYFTLSIGNNLVSYPSMYASINLIDEDANDKYLNDIIENGLITEYIANVRDMMDKVPDSRVKPLINNFFAIVSKIPEEQPGFFTLESDIHIQYFIKDLLMRIEDEKERINLFLDLIDKSDIETLLSISALINMIELAQGRLAGDHIKENEIVFSVEDILRIEASYSSKIREGLEKYNILDSKDYQMASYIWKCIDRDNHDRYMRALLNTSENKLLYIARNAHKSNSSRDGLCWTFNIQRDFQDFLTVEEAIHTINQAIKNGYFNNIPSELRNRTAAFILYTSSSMGDFDSVPDARAKKWIDNLARN